MNYSKKNFIYIQTFIYIGRYNIHNISSNDQIIARHAFKRLSNKQVSHANKKLDSRTIVTLGSKFCRFFETSCLLTSEGKRVINIAVLDNSQT